jgi:hypothetical protein
MQQMTELIEEDLENISKALDMPKERVVDMTEEEILNAFEMAIQQTELEIKFKTEKIAFFRSENIKLRIKNTFLRLGCVVRQIQIGFTLALKDLERFLNF